MIEPHDARHQGPGLAHAQPCRRCTVNMRARVATAQRSCLCTLPHPGTGRACRCPTACDSCTRPGTGAGCRGGLHRRAARLDDWCLLCSGADKQRSAKARACIAIACAWKRTQQLLQPCPQHCCRCSKQRCAPCHPCASRCLSVVCVASALAITEMGQDGTHSCGQQRMDQTLGNCLKRSNGITWTHVQAFATSLLVRRTA